MTPFGDKLAAWRLFRGLTQEQIAGKSGVPRPNLVALEKGRRECTLSTLHRLALAVGITPGTLLDRDPPGYRRKGVGRHTVDRLARRLLGGGGRIFSGREEGILRQAAFEGAPLLKVAGVKSRVRGRRVMARDREIVDQILARVRKLVSYVLQGGKL